MSDKPDDKGLLNELLPDPKQAAEDLAQGSPRDRTAQHLKRILAAGLALQTAGCGFFGFSDPPPPPPPSAIPPPNSQTTSTVPPTTIGGVPSGYAVVDPIPPPPPSPSPRVPTPRMQVNELQAIGRLVEDYRRAIEEKDLALFKRLKPNLTADAETRLRESFQASGVATVRITVLGVQISGVEATVRLSRQDTVEGQSRTFPQTLQLTKGPAGWVIREIGR